MITALLTTKPRHKCHECGGEYFDSIKLAPGIYSDECIECGAELLDIEPFEHGHPGAGMMCEGLIEHELQNLI